MKKKKPAQIHTDAKGLFLIAVGFLGLVALLSFNIHHMSSNWLGFLGYAAALGTQYLFGLGGFLIPCYLLWWGYRLLSSQKHSAADHLYFLIFLGSLSILFNVFAETLPDRAAGFASKVFTETIFLPSPYPRTIVRYNLGGVPFLFSLPRPAVCQFAAHPQHCGNDAHFFDALARLLFAFDEGQDLY